ncbi:MAG: FAD:protein FMN transferase [Proteobacteria bacterium]|nr:MAG: FAD:protein FMN transferase [Pseudomonadota bacterium]
MSRCRSVMIGVLLLAVLVGCSRPTTYNQRIYVFGTLVDVTVWGIPEDQARARVDELAQAFQGMHTAWHAWRPGALGDLNEAIAQGRDVEVAGDLVPLLRQATDLYLKSDGLFNPAIGRLIALWGFHKDDPLDGRPPPAPEVVATLVSSDPGMDDLIIEGNRVSSRNRDVQVDLGGFAKGYAVDWAITSLRRNGVEHAIVNAGGDLRAIGSKGEQPWRIGVRHPQGNGVLAAIEVQGDESIFTSGNYERYNEHQGIRYPHIIDPRTGQPVQGVTSVTVIHHNGAEADAAATALVVAGVKEWPRIARQMGIDRVMLVEENGIVHMTPAMAERVAFQGQRPPVQITPLP